MTEETKERASQPESSTGLFLRRLAGLIGLFVGGMYVLSWIWALRHTPEGLMTLIGLAVIGGIATIAVLLSDVFKGD